MEEKLVAVIMGQDCEEQIEMVLDSVKDADAVVYCDGGSDDRTVPILVDEHGFSYRNEEGRVRKSKGNKEGREIIYKKFDKTNPKANGQQRNFYLDYLKKNYNGWYCIMLDADEVLDDMKKLKEWLNKFGHVLEDVYPAIAVKMRHFTYNLGNEDFTKPEHFVPRRLFKVKKGLYYTEVEHSILKYKHKECPPGFAMRDIVIWHFREAWGVFNTLKKYKWNKAKSNMHDNEQLNWWYMTMIYGLYPHRVVFPQELPEAIRKFFMLDKL